MMQPRTPAPAKSRDEVLADARDANKTLGDILANLPHREGARPTVDEAIAEEMRQRRAELKAQEAAQLQELSERATAAFAEEVGKLKKYPIVDASCRSADEFVADVNYYGGEVVISKGRATLRLPTSYDQKRLANQIEQEYGQSPTFGPLTPERMISLAQECVRLQPVLTGARKVSAFSKKQATGVDLSGAPYNDADLA